ncbi:chromosome segregation protein [Enterococcus sp. PF1-24]|uniref:chromosome segregation protein SMC n=1 Tax=unclassified Enterococcus TaxID=2608891 RepID=UPI002473E807|nr:MULTISPECIES: chromosome segregation protein SMC [unclassified Enterococcus]MDH6363835.1 chromosome segregation protein [Enterococcus sp. PFB1-1]MDH6400979.1 chromosome segregation protein [Enterococcus sp. PF1-24]
MHLKRIEIAGFKSFADRTVIDFENSVTAVVGPNGSGKSNITEAIRWVLGEQSAKSLRGGKMPDIIFAGSESRKPLNIAEVTIILDNSDAYLPLDFSEISVTRRYRRSGESDFYINKQSCRLKDINDLFMDSGLGKESFSIISQGKVEAIFSSKPEERRGIFEEAAGVLKYKQRKKKAEQKLFETEDNLSRVQDIIYELEDQLAPLEKQSQAAEQFLTLKKQLTEVDVSAQVTEIQETKEQWDQQAALLTDLNQELTNLVTEIQGNESRLFDFRQKRSQADEKIEEYNQQILRLAEAAKQAEGQKEVLLERSKNTLKNTQEYQDALSEAEERIANIQGEIQTVSEKITAKKQEINDLAAEVAETEASLVKYQKSSKEIIAELRVQYTEVLQEQAQTNNDLKHLERQYQQETAKNQQTLEKAEELENNLQTLKAKSVDLAEQHQGMATQLQERRQQYVAMQQTLGNAEAQFKTEQQSMYQLMSRVQQVRARQKSLQEIHDNYTGFYQGVRLILQNKNQLSGILGAVAELIEVPTEYTLAIETALGGAAQHIVVESEKDARQGITFLKERKGGRGTFLPLTTIKGRYLNINHEKKAAEIPGYLGVASKLISYPQNIANIAESLLGNIIIAKDLASANQIAKAIQYQARVVSLEGDVMNAGGSMTGGATKRGNQGNLFSQGQELQQLTDEYQRLNQQLAQKEQLVKQLEEKVRQASTKLEELRTAGEQAGYQEQELANRLSNSQESLQRGEKELQLFQYESRELQRFLEEYQVDKEKLEAQRQQLETNRQAVDEEIQLLTHESEKVEEMRQQLLETRNQQQAALGIAKEQENHLQIQLQGFHQQLREAENRQESLQRQIEALTSDSTVFETNEETLNKQVANLQDGLTNAKDAWQAEKEQRQSLQEQVDALDQQLTAKNKQQKELLSKQTQMEVQKNRAEIQLDTALAYLQEEYNLTYEGALAQYPLTADLTEAKREVRELKRQIEHLGPVNLNAIEQYQQVSERYEFLTSQRDDLLSAKDQLFETMAEMDEEVKHRFKEVFEAIRSKFQVIFPKMFGGGRAELRLTDPTDLLNTGIEIEAQPPGKKLQSLSLLSGGERALTAIALLFSIIQVRTVPFCVLDEVEAALDEANVARFGHYLSQFQSDTQFIVVTHRKGTMEAANVLYGVTMQESGVSKIVSVRLEDVSDDGRIAIS